MSPYIKNFEDSSRYSERKIWRFGRFLSNNLLLFVLFFLIVFLSFVYLGQVSEIAKLGYDIYGLEKKIKLLSVKNTDLSVKISSIKSKQKIGDFLNDFKMVELESSDSIGYVQVLARQTALK